MKRVATPSGDNPPPKRTKASQACASCRRQKSRCEILDVRPAPGAPVAIRCHRCKVLNVECSFETSDLIHFSPQTTSSQISPSASSSAPSAARSPASPGGVPSPDSYGGGLNTLATIASSRLNVPEIVADPLPSHSGMLPEDLLPTATTPLWGCVSRVDWTATPMLAIQELVRCSRTDTTGPQLPSGSRLSDILTPPEITSLLEMFETRYTPWLCAQPGPLESSNSLLDIVRCTIASRHMSPSVRSSIAPRLQKLTEEAFHREIFNPQPSLESIRALLILSIWTPICGTGAEARDGRLLIASAVSMAMNLHLEKESKRTASLRAEKDKLTPDNRAELHESMEKWRLWMYLSTSESMLCLGTGRTPVSHLSQVDQEMIDLNSLPHFTLSSVRDIRLAVVGKMSQMAESALRLRLKSVKDLESFFEDINNSMYAMEGFSRLFMPLPIIAEFDTFYSQMLLLQYSACRLLIMHHALREVRTAYEREAPLLRWYAAEIKGRCISLFWGHLALIAAETVLSTFLAPADLTLLNTAPDNLYVQVGFAATWIFVSNFSLHQLGHTQLGGASERLQSMTIARLNQIAHAPEHAAARCGHVLAALMSAWKQRQPSETHLRTCMLDISFFPVPTVLGHKGFDPPSYEDLAGSAATAEAAPNNSDLFMDDAFWASFIENLNSDTFIAQNSGMA
ncbi:hypothetical protein DFH06DRAFT_1075306 [Mycena polygramma]|nr:hypothetical protein DFH06DRAFT_1075306 [Mycena polygramma]